jgi:DNA-binding response OmpR family regulator
VNHKQDLEYPVLIVDDRDDILNSMKVSLLRNGITDVEICRDSRQVMSLLEKNKFSLILLDIVMPYIRGDELLPRIVKEYPGTPVIMITAYPAVENAVGCIKKGAFDYVVKPFSTPKLLEKVKKALKSFKMRKILFISYSHNDKEFVSRLTRDLKNAVDLDKGRVEIWIDKNEIKVGDSISKKVEDGICACDFFCLVISGNSLESQWVEREYRAAINKQLSSNGTPVILPILIENVQLPLFLKDIRCANFSLNYQAGLMELLDSIKNPGPA